MFSCKTTLFIREAQSVTLSSSHAIKRRRHTHPKPPASHPKRAISSTKHSLLTDNSYRRLNWIFKGTPPSQLSVQRKVVLPSPTTRLILLSNHLSTAAPLPSHYENNGFSCWVFSLLFVDTQLPYAQMTWFSWTSFSYILQTFIKLEYNILLWILNIFLYFVHVYSLRPKL